MDFVNVLLYCWLVLIKWPEGEDLLSRRVPVSGIVPDQFCEQFFEQNIDFPAEKKLLAKCEQNIEILMKIDPKQNSSKISVKRSIAQQNIVGSAAKFCRKISKSLEQNWSGTNPE